MMPPQRHDPGDHESDSKGNAANQYGAPGKGVAPFFEIATGKMAVRIRRLRLRPNGLR